MSSKTPQTRQPISKKTALSIMVIVLLPTLFIVILLIAFKKFWVLPFLLLLLVIAAGITWRVRPDFFSSLRKGHESAPMPGAVPPEPVSASPSRHTHMMLVAISQGVGQQIAVDTSPFVIGRAPESDYRISDSYVSGRHLVIEYEEDENRCYATDVSSNGTSLNSVRMQNNVRRPLYQGDTLQIAGLLFRVEYVNF